MFKLNLTVLDNPNAVWSGKIQLVSVSTNALIHTFRIEYRYGPGSEEKTEMQTFNVVLSPGPGYLDSMRLVTFYKTTPDSFSKFAIEAVLGWITKQLYLSGEDLFDQIVPRTNDDSPFYDCRRLRIRYPNN